MSAPLNIAAAVVGHATGGVVDRHPFAMIFGLALVPVVAGAALWLGGEPMAGLAISSIGAGLVLLVLPRLVRARRLAREHAAQRAAWAKEQEASSE